MPNTKTPDYKKFQIQFLTVHTLAGTATACLATIPFNQTNLPAAAALGALLGTLAGIYRAWFAPCDLSDWQIASLKKHIHPFNPQQIEPDSYDVTLADQFHQILPNGKTKTITTDQIIIEPGECWLAHTLETFHFPNTIKGTLQGKSSWARLSLFVECAGLFDKGFHGTAVLELHNAGTWAILLKKGDRIAQMSFHRTLPACAPYAHPKRQSHYQSQSGPKESWLVKANRIIPRP